jgi:GT2 family glycosyltransferase
MCPVSTTPSESVVAGPVRSRWRAAGKFFRDGDSGETVFVKAVTWGPFPPGEMPDPEREMRRVRDDLGANALRVYEVPDRAFLDCCAGIGLRVFVGFPWTQHVDFIHEYRILRDETERFRRVVSEHRGHPAIAGWFVANEIPSTLVRWMGPRAVNRALEDLIRAGRDADPEALFSYANYPSTEYLCPRGQDFIAFNVYLENRDDYARYLRRLQHQAGDLPLMIAEFGLDAGAHGEDRQAAALVWHLEETARVGAAGTTLFAWSDLWYRGGETIDGWDFGLTRRDGSAKPAVARVAETWRDWKSPADALGSLGFPRPRVSVVVCTYRGARLLGACLASLRRLRYPDYEVIVVNDGGDAAVAAVAEGFPEVRHLNLAPHGGLSAARNLGARAATGEIVAYTDDDCEADPDWLTWLAWAFAGNDLTAAGGPNIPPPPESRTRAIVAAAPGGPAHVLLNDVEAEHLPGCNLAVRREAIEAVGGFDERFWSAGDDVDFCWRLIAAGHRIGFHPAAMVWHHRRFTVKAYLKQQFGYGRAEAMLMPLYPGRFGLRGGARWRGRVYLEGPAARLATSGARIYHGHRGLAPYQALYGEGSSHSTAALMLDWTWIGTAALLIGLGGIFGLRITGFSGAAMLVASAARAWLVAGRADIFPPYQSRLARIGVALLALIQGPVRSARRSFGLIDRRREEKAVPQPSGTVATTRGMLDWYLPERRFAFWGEKGLDGEDWVRCFESRCRSRGWSLTAPPADSRHDVEIGPWRGWRSRLAAVSEYHGNDRILIRVGVRHAPTWAMVLLCGVILTGLVLAAASFIGSENGWSGKVVAGAVVLIAAGFLFPLWLGPRSLEFEIRAAAGDLELNSL